MTELKLTETETKLADLMWAREPIPSGDLVKICRQEFSWKKSTTYTMLKRLENKGVFENTGGLVSSLLTKDEFFARQSKQFVEETFDGSLPRFLTAFSRSKKLTSKEIAELQRLINEHREG